MRILHLIQSLGFGGAENMLIKLVNQDVENEILILTLVNEIPLKEKILNDKVLIVSIADRKSLNILKAVIKTNKIVKEFKPDVLQAWMYHSELVGLIVKLLNPKLKLFWNVRCSTEYWRKLRFRNQIILKMLILGSNRVSGILVNSMSELRYISKIGFPENKIEYIPNGFGDVDLSIKNICRQKLLEKFGLKNNSFIIGMVARNDPAKDHKNILKAMQLLNVDSMPIHLVLVGSGYNAEFDDLIKSYNLQDAVHIYGTTNSIFETILSFDMGVLSSKTESFPNVVAEYMLAGLPVVCSDVSDIGLIVEDAGIIVPPQDSEALTSAIKKMYYMSEFDRIKMGLSGRNLILEKYSIQKIWKTYNECYHKALATN